jgi:hypothetical protein
MCMFEDLSLFVQMFQPKSNAYVGEWLASFIIYVIIIH